jgi:hypothetical protein
MLSGVLIPRKYKYTFKEMPVSKIIEIGLEKNAVISYY